MTPQASLNTVTAANSLSNCPIRVAINLPIAAPGVGQHGVEQKAPIARNCRGFLLGAFRLLRFMLCIVIISSAVLQSLYSGQDCKHI